MDDTTATPPTSATASASAAAVKADGANAAVNVKAATAAAGAGNTTATPTSGTSVKLLIKASNQQYDDQIIESDLTWTVRRLKTHLAMVYPSKPPVAEQKLIYSGQLLNDLMLLKDVIRSYKDVYTQNHIIHLVYMPKSMTIPKPASKKTKIGTSATDSATSSTTTTSATQDNNMLGGNSSTDGLRQRHVPPGLPGFHTMQQQTQRQFMQFAQFAGAMPGMAAQSAHMSPMLAAAYMQQMQHTPAACYPPAGSNPAFAANSLAAQQMAMYNAWMQQVYAQYMEQYARLSSSATGTAGQSQSSDYLSAAMHAMQQHQMPFYHPNASTVIPTPPNMLPAFPPNFVGVNQANSVAEQQQPAAQAAAQEQQQQQQVAEQRRFPNIVQDEAENRDWLDSFFSLTRLAIFLTILYFNTSPLRCFIVLIIGGAIYLYHIGVLRIRTERNNNNINRNNNAERQIRQGQDQIQPGAAANNPPNDDADAAANDGNGGDTVDAATDPLLPSSGTEDQLAPQENPSVIAFVRTLVISFFTSLLPETPAL